MAIDTGYFDSEGRSIDPPMTDYEREILGELRKVFAWPYHVIKVLPRNDGGLTWNPDFWVGKKNKGVLVVKALAPDTTIENLDARMREAYATLVLNWEEGRHGGTLVTGSRALIVPDKVLENLGQERYLKYHYALEPFDCEIIRKSAIPELELHRDKEDREKRPIRW